MAAVADLPGVEKLLRGGPRLLTSLAGMSEVLTLTLLSEPDI
jgi:hypothetical protein